LSQVEAGKTILQVREFSLAQVARQTTTLLQDKADSKQVQLCLELLTSERLSRSGDNPSRTSSHQSRHPLSAVDLNAPAFRFQADPQRVQQILLNLLSNAIKFTPPHGRVTLRVRVHGETAILQVEDTGIGIAQDQQSLLFQKFQQLDASYHRKYEGTGLGLALTKQFVELHGGTIEVNSTVGVGSTFTVFLPAQVLSAVDRAQERQKSPPILHPRIVLVEEQEEIATLICDLLTAADYQVIWIMDSSAAIRQIEVLQPMVAIVDLQLPGLNGYQIIRHLRTHRSTQDIKVLALTPQVPTDGSEPDVDDYFVTPLLNGTAKLLSQPEQIIDKVTTLVTRP
jgi:two-component system, sensor histidine kinase and response regulator